MGRSRSRSRSMSPVRRKRAKERDRSKKRKHRNRSKSRERRRRVSRSDSRERAGGSSRLRSRDRGRSRWIKLLNIPKLMLPFLRILRLCSVFTPTYFFWLALKTFPVKLVTDIFIIYLFRSRSRSYERRHHSPYPSSSKSKINPAVSVSEADLEGKTPEEIEMMKVMGFCGFDTTKNKKVEDNNSGTVHVILKRKYRWDWNF